MIRVIWRRLLGLILVLVMAWLWVLLSATPAYAQENTVNHALTDLSYHDYSNQNLVGGVFAGAEMRGINFQGADLSGSIFTKANLLKANLEGANLTNSLADRVFLDQAILTNAILTDAIMNSTRFYDAEITGADFTDALIDRYQAKLMCKRATGVNPVTKISTRDSLGCR
ncbi:MAG: pentapeptide repeat-containing protein [Moorea sp. SIO1F2]|uniref:pentapeptide repeat-containing protein n=1 Tax=Moorena sp. SIO1F2 TaxID=2607819 RepID=UPI0013BE84D8|nr:pentapeptide repeat-containing protein [Moorena sp. SIO1F2]NET85685.1 pentapeptide repeat-containing protein [Moorena sp. SIO1F2]